MKSIESDSGAEKTPLCVVDAVNPQDDFVLINTGEFSLLLAVSALVAVIPFDSYRVSGHLTNKGRIEFQGECIAIFSLTKLLQLDMLDFSSPTQTSVAVLEYQQQRFGITCCDLDKCERSSLTLFDVPVSMTSRKQPFTQFAIVNNCAAGLASVADIVRLLRVRGADIAAVSTASAQLTGS